MGMITERRTAFSLSLSSKILRYLGARGERRYQSEHSVQNQTIFLARLLAEKTQEGQGHVMTPSTSYTSQNSPSFKLRSVVLALAILARASRPSTLTLTPLCTPRLLVSNSPHQE
eukprot:6197187-Pleurochrysis_carterae.AAC.1